MWKHGAALAGPPTAQDGRSLVPADSLCCSSVNEEDSEKDLPKGASTALPMAVVQRSPGDKLL